MFDRNGKTFHLKDWTQTPIKTNGSTDCWLFPNWLLLIQLTEQTFKTKANVLGYYKQFKGNPIDFCYNGKHGQMVNMVNMVKW